MFRQRIWGWCRTRLRQHRRHSLNPLREKLHAESRPDTRSTESERRQTLQAPELTSTRVPYSRLVCRAPPDRASQQDWCWRIVWTNVCKQREGGDTTVAEEDQHHRSEKFADHFTEGAFK